MRGRGTRGEGSAGGELSDGGERLQPRQTLEEMEIDTRERQRKRN